MLRNKKEHPTEKIELHPRNKHRERYDFNVLIDAYAELAPFVTVNKYQDESIDFFNPTAVQALNKALLKHYYTIDYWEIPKGYLCPPIPGRADYIHHIADLLGESNDKRIPIDSHLCCLDVGVGANCIYPLLGAKEYGWRYIGTDIDPISIDSAQTIVEKNPSLKGLIEIRLQANSKHILKGIVQKDERIDLTMCNPPFHGSLAEAQAGTIRKVSNLKEKKTSNPILNFGGQNNELWCEGGEVTFITDLINESKLFANSCFWFSSLVSKETSLKQIYYHLKITEAAEIRTIPMSQGNKRSRIVAWTFLSPEQQEEWVKKRWIY